MALPTRCGSGHSLTLSRDPRTCHDLHPNTPLVGHFQQHGIAKRCSELLGTSRSGSVVPLLKITGTPACCATWHAALLSPSNVMTSDDRPIKDTFKSFGRWAKPRPTMTLLTTRATAWCRSH
jgi:hypothetical protein